MSTRTLDTVVRPLFGALAVVALSATAGCGGDASADAGAGANEPAAAQSGGSARTSGTLVIGETTYDFIVLRCNLASEYHSPEGQETLRGHGELDDGTPFRVSAARIQVSDGLVLQKVTLRTYTALDRLHWSADRSNAGYGWFGEGMGEPAPDEPLVIVAGKTVSAEATFRDARYLPDGELKAPVMGRLVATCP
jgi:hypothetical protein